MKTIRTEKLAKARVKISRRERIKSFNDEESGEVRRFETPLQGFGFREEKHEASQYLSKTLARVTMSSRGRVTIPRELRARLGIKPGQMVSITDVNGVVHIVPIRQSRKSDRGRLPKLRPFVREKHDRFG